MEQNVEFRLNPQYFSNDSLQSLINQGFQARMMTNEEIIDGDSEIVKIEILEWKSNFIGDDLWNRFTLK